METVTRFTERYTGAAVDTSKVAPIEAARTLAVTVSYLLSEDGRKASLLGGGNGHEVQQLAVQVPANRFGHAVYSAPQLKGLQEILTLLVFAGFSTWYLGEAVKWNHIAAFVLIVAAAFLLFLD